MSRLVHFLRCIGIVGLLVVGLGLWGAQSSTAQVWVRTAHVSAPVTPEGVHSLLDTLARVESLPVRQSPSDTQPMPISALRDTLRRTYGLDITDANRVRVGYRFSVQGMEGFKWTLTDLHFSYGGSPTTDNIPLLYLDPQAETVHSMLQSAGPFSESEFSDAPASFRAYLGMVNLLQLGGAEIVEIGGQSVTEGFDVRKRVLIRKVYRLTYLDTY